MGFLFFCLHCSFVTFWLSLGEKKHSLLPIQTEKSYFFIIILLCFNRQKVQLLSDVSVAILLNCHMLWSSRCTLRCFQAVLGAYRD